MSLLLATSGCFRQNSGKQWPSGCMVEHRPSNSPIPMWRRAARCQRATRCHPGNLLAQNLDEHWSHLLKGSPARIEAESSMLGKVKEFEPARFLLGKRGHRFRGSCACLASLSRLSRREALIILHQGFFYWQAWPITAPPQASYSFNDGDRQ
jgi:hypothetical protein